MKIRIEGVPPYDGTWDAGSSMDVWTNAEWAILKRVSGELPLTVEEKLVGADLTVVTAIAIIALRRSGRFGVRINEDALWEAPAPSFRLYLDDEDSEVDPDPLPTREPGTLGTPSGSHSLNGSAEISETTLEATGLRSSDTPASDQETSTT